MKSITKPVFLSVCFSILLIGGCSNMETPATATVAVSNAAVTNASNAGGTQYAPLEMRSAREKMDQANQALKDKDYQKADDLAKSAQADAQLAQSKADTAKAQAAAAALQSDIRVLQEQINHSNQ